MVLMFTDVVGSVDLKHRIGTTQYADALSRHDAIFKQLIANCPGADVLTDTGDGFFACFASSSDAVRAALLFQQLVRRDADPLRVRIGLHVGEVTQMGDEGGKPKVIGLAADFAARLNKLANGDQILLTRFPFNEARQFIRSHPEIDGAASTSLPEIRWIAHGEYLFRGSDEPMEVFEVGAAGFAPLAPPADNDAARRAVRPGDEVTLGWRPATGMEMRNRPLWVIREKLGEGGFGEVWLAEHAKTRTRRVFKFCFDPQRVPALKREVVLFRLMKDALGDRRDIARVTDYQFDENPYFIEYEYIGAGSLPQWADTHGGIAKIPLEVRIRLVAQVAEALGAAHSVGVIHKDVKPSNILIARDSDDAKSLVDIHPVLIDFGIGMLTDRSQLQRHDITEFNFTHSDIADNDSSRTGTRMYAPPESLIDRPHTVQGDVYALGVLLYQMVIADLARPLAPGWERDVTDEVLREDIAACVQGDPTRRLSNGIEIAKRLETIPQRRAAREEAQRAQRAQARRKQLTAWLATALGIAVIGGAVLFLALRERMRRVDAERQARTEAEAARDRITAEAEKANAVTAFLRDMITSVDPAKANKRDITVREMLDVAAAKIDEKSFPSPEVEASVRQAIGRTYLTMKILKPAQEQISKAVEIAQRVRPDDRATLQWQSDLTALYLYSAEYAKGEQVALDLLERRRKLLGPDDPDTADTLYNLQLLAGEQRKFDDAQKYGRDALAIREKRFGPDSLKVADSLQYLGLYTGQAGKLDEAIKLLTRSLELRQKLLPANHFEIGNALSNLGLMHLQKGEHPQAEARLKAALANFEVSLDPTHSNVATVLSNLSGIYLQQEDYKSALPYAKRALEIQERVLPSDHPNLAIALHGVGLIYYSNNDWDNAIATMKRSYEIMRNRFGDENAYTLQPKLVLASIYRDMKRFDDAEPMLREIVEGSHKIENSEILSRSQFSLAAVLYEQAKYDRAETEALGAIETARQLPNPLSQRKVTGESLGLLVEVYKKQNKPGKAAEFEARYTAATQPSSAPATTPSR
ncbi:MAG: tetratricopeptide repeat protein [Anaerolineae bacterium]|nr:tetratricopeptide repeat protein [Phycisphaerae bacterium]